MVGAVDPAAREVDLLIVTGGGDANAVKQLVDTLRARFDRVEFIIPFMAMSAGTLWALSGERIWMTSDAFIGPIDPQAPTKTGRLVPAQSLLVLIEELQRKATEAIAKKAQVPWHVLALLRLGLPLLVLVQRLCVPTIDRSDWYCDPLLGRTDCQEPSRE